MQRSHRDRWDLVVRHPRPADGELVEPQHVRHGDRRQHHREEVRPLKHSVGWADAPSEPVADGQDPGQTAGLALEMVRVRAAMASLPPEQQEALALAYFKGYSHSEIAEVLDLSAKTVSSRLHRCRTQLKKQLKEFLE